MKMKITMMSILTVIVSLTMSGFCQNVAREGKIVKSSQPAMKYDRSALSMILVSYANDSHTGQLQGEFPKIKVPDKFDDNTLNLQVMSLSENRNVLTTGVSKNLQNLLNKNKVGNAIIARWYNRQSDGSFNMDVISQRGLYNATDMDVVNASAKKIGQAALKDAGEKLLANSYIIVMDYPGIMTAEEDYNARKVVADKRTSHGWVGNFTAYVFKLNLNDSISSVFYNDLWVNKDDNSSIKAARSSKFESTDFPVSFITSVQGSLTSEQTKPGKSSLIKQKSDDQLFSEMVNKGVEEAEYQIAAKLEAFRVKTSVFSIHPIAAKIGKKEGLKGDNRYFVFEQEEKKDVGILAVRKAVIRATNQIIDNRSIATGNSNKVSKFYQIGGSKVSEGMLLQQKNDIGIGLYASYAQGEIGGIGAGLEFLLTKVVPGMPLSTKLFIEGGYQTKEYSFQESDSRQNWTFMRYNAGLSKSIYFARNFQIEPSISVGKEKASYDGIKTDKATDSYSALFVKPGLKLGINLQYNIQLMAGVNYYSFIGDIKDSNDNAVTGVNSWSDAFKDRGGISYEFGLRFQF